MLGPLTAHPQANPQARLVEKVTYANRAMLLPLIQLQLFDKLSVCKPSQRLGPQTYLPSV